MRSLAFGALLGATVALLMFVVGTLGLSLIRWALDSGLLGGVLLIAGAGAIIGAVASIGIDWNAR